MSTYPYVSGPGPVIQTFAQLRKGFPAKVDAGYLKRFSIAPANESYIISILRFLGLIDDDGSQREESTGYFFGGDESFTSGLEGTLQSAYSQLFDEMKVDAWTAQKEDLTNWFRAADKTSVVVGQRQASTFQTLAALAGHGEVPTSRGGSTSTKKAAAASRATIPKKPSAKKSAATKVAAENLPPAGGSGNGEKPPSAQGVGLTVRIEVNLPSGGDTATYDAIFASIKKHLMS